MAKHKKGPKQQGGGGKRSGSRLANALAHSRAQEAHLQKLKHSRSVREQQEQARKTNAGGGKAKGKGKAAEDTQVRRRCMIEKGERVLLVGEGNFSFAASLIAHHGVPGHLLTATCYDSSSTLHSKYPDVDSHLSVLEAAGAEVLYDVDAGSLDTDKRTRKRKWDRVAWLFPHVGKGIKDEERNVRANQIELMRFLRAVKGVLEEGKPGEPLPEDEGMSDPDDDDEEVEEDLQRPRSRPGRVCITLRNSHPYTLWDVPYALFSCCPYARSRRSAAHSQNEVHNSPLLSFTRPTRPSAPSRSRPTPSSVPSASILPCTQAMRIVGQWVGEKG